MAASTKGGKDFLGRHAGSKAAVIDREASQDNGGAGASRVEGTVAFAVPPDGNERSKSVSEVEEEKLSNKENGQAASVPMGEHDHSNQQNTVDAAATVSNIQKISILPLVFLIFYEVSGGPFGMEDSVQAAGPLLAILGFLVFPLIWSIPEGLITAEMSTMFPKNGGYVLWVSSAFSPYWGFQLGWMKWLSGVMDNALYPILFLDYLKSVIPALEGGIPRTFAVVGLIVMLTYLNYRGLSTVGWVTVSLGVFSILPFIIMGLMAIPKLKPERWFVVDLHDINWRLYLNTLFWNLNYWDSISTLAGEVDDPKKSLPKSLLYAAILVAISYLYPLLTGTGAVPLDRELWTDGYFSDITKILGGIWLTWWMQGAAASSNMGMFVTKMSSYSYQLLGMAEWGMLPEFFSRRSHHGTPVIAILFSASSVLLLSWLSFQEIIAAENILYCFGMLLEFLAFIRLRMKYPRAPRPYKIPVDTIGSILILTPPTLLIFAELDFASPKIIMVSIAAVIAGLILQPCFNHLKKKQWLSFAISPDLPNFVETTYENAVETLMDQLELELASA